jgi:hypothetical protein
MDKYRSLSLEIQQYSRNTVVHEVYNTYTRLIAAQLSVVHKYLFALALRIVNTTCYRAMTLVVMQMY